MSYAYSADSLAKLKLANPKLGQIFERVADFVNTTIIDSIRTVEQQRVNVARGLSQTMDSKHLPGPDGLSRAVDAAPYPQRWDDPRWRDNQLYFAGFVMGIAAMLGIPLRWGGDWKRDNDPEHNGFEDLDHFELI